MKGFFAFVIFFSATAVYGQAPDTLWTRTYGGSVNDVGNSILQTSDGGYIVAGYTESFGAGESDAWILRLDSLGDTLWAKTYGTAGRDDAVAIQSTTDGAYIIIGTRWSGVDDSSNVWFLKIDEYGDTVWTKTVIPAFWHFRANDAKQTNDGGYVIAGKARTPHYYDWSVVIRTDSLGNILWLNDLPEGYGSAVQETSDGNYVYTGTEQSGMTHDTAFFLKKVDQEGAALWYHIYTDTLPWPRSVGCDVLEASDGCVTACGGVWGSGYYDIYLVRTRATGDTLWTKRYGEGVALSLDETFDGGYIIAGETSEDVVFIKTDALGDTLWTAVHGGSEHDSPSSVLQTSDGGYIMVGKTSSFAAGNADVWIVKLSPDVGVEENKNIVFENGNQTATIFRGPLQLPEGKKCQVFDITGRIIEPDKIQPGIYFIEIDGVVTQKVIKVR